jgi:hypothetical protein
MQKGKQPHDGPRHQYEVKYSCPVMRRRPQHRNQGGRANDAQKRCAKEDERQLPATLHGGRKRWRNRDQERRPEIF